MKFKAVSLICLLVFGFSLSFAIDNVCSQTPDLSIWVGKWFKVSMTQKQFHFANTGVNPTPSNAASVSSTVYLKITGWDGDQTLNANFYAKDDSGNWDPIPIATPGLTYFAGSDSEFVCRVKWETTRRTVDAAVLFSGTTLQTLGGYTLDIDNAPSTERWAGSIAMKGTMVSESKVPAPLRQPTTSLSFSFSPCSSGGDSITVSEVTGTSATIIPGAEYGICGTYTLNSADSAQLVASNYGPYGLFSSTGPPQNIGKGSGSYCVSFTVLNIESGFEKEINIGFYTIPSGNQFFGTGYGCSSIVLQ